jgi:hypothetical protein
MPLRHDRTRTIIVIEETYHAEVVGGVAGSFPQALLEVDITAFPKRKSAAMTPLYDKGSSQESVPQRRDMCKRASRSEAQDRHARLQFAQASERAQQPNVLDECYLFQCATRGTIKRALRLCPSGSSFAHKQAASQIAGDVIIEIRETIEGEVACAHLLIEEFRESEWFAGDEKREEGAVILPELPTKACKR